MIGDSKNESFKLLQLSDDSKSLSDLELPELTTQRKRKVRRKTRPRTTSVRRDDDHVRSQIDCRNFGLWLAILMTILWLFIISYITSVVHSENRRLEIAIEKVSATSQNVPEALQKFHETSKHLEQNQTSLNGKLRELQQVLSNFSTEIKQLRDSIEKKNENSQEAQLNSLKTNVADLGSKIEDASLRIAALEEKNTAAQNEQKTLRKSIDDLQSMLAQFRNSSAPSGVDASAMNLTEQNIANIRDQLSAQISNLSQNFTGELHDLKQKNVWLSSDLEKHKTSIDELVDSSANISSHVKSVENIWVEMKTNLSQLEQGSKQISDQMVLLQNSTAELRGSLGSMQGECARYHNQNDGILNDIGALKVRLDQAEKKLEIPATVASPKAVEPTKKNALDNLGPIFGENSPTQPTLPKSQTGTSSPTAASAPASGQQQPVAAAATPSSSSTTAGATAAATSAGNASANNAGM
ncbi:keratin, type II cytoskeletal 72 isoform X2 [Uranotaenia lowii]|uniref:keratin, type II cytoskeletal 72 isoform X2 n=1 Tax=Uranotaenia lowii TaxID=190385 RepID=UPI0024783F7E|nr:keratin, type II cytoskeletal 72 isoform X2 [Uranotaenia lowii]